MQTNMWRISLLDEGVSNIMSAYSDGTMMPELGAMPITEGFSTTFINLKPRVSLSNSTMQQ